MGEQHLVVLALIFVYTSWTWLLKHLYTCITVFAPQPHAVRTKSTRSFASGIFYVYVNVKKNCFWPAMQTFTSGHSAANVIALLSQ